MLHLLIDCGVCRHRGCLVPRRSDLRRYMMTKKLLLAALGTASVVAVSQAQDVNLWNDTAPSGGTMNLTPSGGAGVFASSSATTNPATYGITGQDWSAYAGREWTFTVDIYITAAQLADAAINDDVIGYVIGGTTNNYIALSGASWWTADAWNTITLKGTFGTTASALTNMSFAFINDDKATHPAGNNYMLDNFNLDVYVPPMDTLWDDQAPVGGNIVLAATTETAVTGGDTGHGAIGEYNSATETGQWGNYGLQSQNWQQYAGKEWRLSIDLYITAAQLADATIGDDLFYYNVVGVQGGYLTVSNALVADAWTTITWTGTFPANPASLANAGVSVVFNDQITHPAGANFYMDNFKFEAVQTPPPAMDTLWYNPNPSGGMFTLVTNAYGTGIGEFTSSIGAGQWENYGTYNNDWSAYAGKAWQFSFEIYLTAAQMADMAVNDDNFFYQVAGVSGGYTTISNSTLVADSWNTVSWSGTFTTDAVALSTNGSARLVNNDQATHPASGANYYVKNFRMQAVAPEPVETLDDLWVDSAPVGGGMLLSQITDPFGTEQGNIGMFKSANLTGGNVSSYGVSNKYWTAYAGQPWTLTFDVFVTSVQLADASINDDSISFTVGGASGGSTAISTLIADEWNKITWTGTFNSDPSTLTSTGVSLVNDDKGTDPVSGPNYFVDNFLLQAAPGATSPPPVYVTATNNIEFVASEGYSDGLINGQKGWVSGGNWTVNTASGGSVTCTNDNINMTLVQLKPMPVDKTIHFSVRYKVQGTHTPTIWTYPARIGITTASNGSNQGYDGPGTSLTKAMVTLQASPSTVDGYRIYGDGWNGPQTDTLDGNPGDEWEMNFSLTMGSSAATTFFTAALTNVTMGIGSAFTTTEDSVGATLFAALESGTAYPYFETGGFEDGLTGIEVLSVRVIYPKQVVDSYAGWASSYGLVGIDADLDADPDGDGLANLAEYAFDGNPVPPNGAADQGTQPVLDGLTYRYWIRGDDALTAYVMATDDLVFTPFAPVETNPITATDGVLSEYTYSVNTSGNNQRFFKINVDRN